MQKISSKRIAPILGCLGALGPLSIDMYLPGMPQIAASLNASASDLQFSLMAFFTGLMTGQLFYGPLSDRLGRKPIIYIGLMLFIAASLGCITATTAEQLTAWRLLQGLGGSIGMVIGIAIVRDLYTGRVAASLVALIMIVLSVAPIAAPLLGTAIIAMASWHALFLVQAVFGMFCAGWTVLALPETRPLELRKQSHPLAAISHYFYLLRRRNFIAYVVVTVLTQAGFFAYLAGSPFVFITLHGLTPIVYSTLFAINAIGLMLGAQIAPRLLGRFRAHSIVRTAIALYAALALLLALVESIDGAALLPLSALLFFIITAQAFVMPLCGMLALDAYRALSGTAAALMGALQFGAGMLSSLAVGSLNNGTALPMAAVIALSGIIACVVAFIAFPRSDALSIS